jgi:electron transport complex protein RnfD
MSAMAVFALGLQAFAPFVAMPVDFHLLAGGALFGAVFMATDMVTSPITRWGHVVFGIGCGVLTMIIRVVPGGAYPEGVTFAILIMCALTPLINRATRYQRWGIGKRATVRKAAS